jgi:tight adherence protein B
MPAEEVLLDLIVFLAVALGTAGTMEMVSVRKKMNALNKRLGRLHTEEARKSKGLYRRLASKFHQSDYGRDWEDKLRSANLKLEPFDWMLILSGVFAAGSVLLSQLFSLRFPLNITAAFFVVNTGSKRWLKGRAAKYAQMINRQLPEVCRMLAGCIRAGLSVQQGIEMVARELKPPAGPLFQTMASELKMGTTLDEVLTRLHERFASKDIRLLTQTILVQRRAGGNLGQALDHLAKTLEERDRMNQELSNQTAESRYIATTLALMPFFLIIAFNMVFKGFIMPLFSLPGMILLAVVAVLMTIGFLLIRKVTNIKA